MNQSFGVGIMYNKNFDTFRGFLGLEERQNKSKNKISEIKQISSDSIPTYKLPKVEERRIDSIRQNLKDSTKVSYQKTDVAKPKKDRRGLVRIR